jgi:hypothetical protein
MEIDPTVLRHHRPKRWENLTGETAVLADA